MMASADGFHYDGGTAFGTYLPGDPFSVEKSGCDFAAVRTAPRYWGHAVIVHSLPSLLIHKAGHADEISAIVRDLQVAEQGCICDRPFSETGSNLFYGVL